MHTQHVFQLTLLVFLVVCGINASSVPKLSGVSSPNVVNTPRSLRAAMMVNGESSHDDEERGVSSFIQNGLTKMKLKSWVAFDKSDDYVKKALGMKGLTGAALNAHPNRKTFQKFKLANWLKKNTPPSTVWDDLGLNGFTLDQVRTADGIGTYIRYLMLYDEKFLKYTKKGSTFKIYPGNSPVEKQIKADLLGGFGRDPNHVKLMVNGNV